MGTSNGVRLSNAAVMDTQIVPTASANAKEQAFTAVVNEHLDAIYVYARYMVIDHDEADDIAQKTFLSLYNNFAKLDLGASLKPWLFKVARNHCLDYFKKKKTLRFSEVEPEVLEIPQVDYSLEARLDDILFQQKFKGLVAQLPAQMREVLLLKYFQDLTLEQVADFTSQSLNTVKSNFYRGKAKLYQLIKSS